MGVKRPCSAAMVAGRSSPTKRPKASAPGPPKALAPKKVEVRQQASSRQAKESKFKPRPIKAADHKVPRIDGAVPRGASILIIQEPWINLLLDGHKTLEIRGMRCNKPAGEKVYFALSGGGGILLGGMTFVACHGPLAPAEYAERCEQHCVAGTALPYGASTYAWEFKAPVRFRQPVPYLHRHGVVTWAKKD